LARRLTLVGRQAVEVPLDGEQGVDPVDRFERQGRDRCWRLVLSSSLNIGGQIGQLEELAAGMRPAAGFQDPAGPIEPAIAAIGVGLQDPAPALQMALGMLAGSVA